MAKNVFFLKSLTINNIEIINIKNGIVRKLILLKNPLTIDNCSGDDLNKLYFPNILKFNSFLFDAALFDFFFVK